MAEELTGRKIDHLRYGAGYIDMTTTVVPPEKRLPAIALKNGKEVNGEFYIQKTYPLLYLSQLPTLRLKEAVRIMASYS